MTRHRETVGQYVARVTVEAEHGREARVAGHVADVDFDWGRAFRSQNGGNDWAVSCSCGWRASAWKHSETEGFAAFWRHLKKV